MAFVLQFYYSGRCRMGRNEKLYQSFFQPGLFTGALVYGLLYGSVGCQHQSVRFFSGAAFDVWNQRDKLVSDGILYAKPYRRNRTGLYLDADFKRSTGEIRSKSDL